MVEPTVRHEDELERVLAEMVPELHYRASLLERVSPVLGMKLRTVADDCALMATIIRRRRYEL